MHQFLRLVILNSLIFLINFLFPLIFHFYFNRINFSFLIEIIFSNFLQNFGLKLISTIFCNNSSGYFVRNMGKIVRKIFEMLLQQNATHGDISLLDLEEGRTDKRIFGRSSVPLSGQIYQIQFVQNDLILPDIEAEVHRLIVSCGCNVGQPLHPPPLHSFPAELINPSLYPFL